jgi:hypothetical protein
VFQGRIKLAFATVFAVAVAALLPVNSAVGQETIVVQDTSVTFTFPEVINFHISASGPDSIVRAELKYTLPQLACGNVVATALPEVTPGRDIDLSWEWNLLERGGLPVGANVHYQWVLEDASGRRIETPERSIVFEDPRFTWRTLETDRVSVHWYFGDEPFANDLLRTAEAGLDQLATTTGATLSDRVHIYLYEDSITLQSALAFPNQWTGGVAFSSFGLVAIAIGPYNLDWGRRAMVHEMTHVVIYQATFTCGSFVPAWLDEGLAMFNEGPLEPAYRQILQTAIDRDETFAVRSLLGGFPNDPSEAQLAYAQSQSLVTYLVEEYGPARMQELFEAFRDLGAINATMEKVYGFDQEGLNLRWRESVGLPVSDAVPTPMSPSFVLPVIQPLSPATGFDPEGQISTPTPTTIATPPSATAATATPTLLSASGSGCNANGAPAAGMDMTALAGFLALGFVGWRRRRQ